ncbi:MAG: bifunctional heptose 7-phosphate kinase/heptose 1-phosphate adenyltransferase, partial [Gemmatimonadales bacterium]
MRQTPQPPLGRDRILHLIEKMKSSRIVVVGDVMLDRYLLGDTERLSPEAPVPVVTVTERRTKLGGAANVAANVVAIGASCRLVGVVGDDQDGATLRHEMLAAQIDERGVAPVAGRVTTSKTRVMARGQQVVRIDEEVDALLAAPDLERLNSRIEDAVAEADALLLEDYNKGALAPSSIRTA